MNVYGDYRSTSLVFLRLLISQDEHLREMSLSLLTCVSCLGTSWYIQNRRLVHLTSDYRTKLPFSHCDTFRICVLSNKIAMAISHYETGAFLWRTLCANPPPLNAVILDFYCRHDIQSPREIVAKTKQSPKLHCYVRCQAYCYVPP